MITENLSSCTKCIPETIVISVPSSKDALLKCIEFSNSRTKNYIDSLRSSLRGDTSNVLCKEEEMITYLYINPVDKSFYELVKKKNTVSNSLLTRLTNSYCRSLLSPIELKNEGWRIERVLSRSEVINTSCFNDFEGDTNRLDEINNHLVIVLSHPDMRNVIYSKFGYDINEYPNLYTVVLVSTNFLSDYLNTFNKSFVYGNSFDTVRIVDNVVRDKTCPSLFNISAKTEFIPEDYYKANTKRLNYAIKLGNVESNLVSLNNKYIPGHVYKFQGKSSAFELLSASYSRGQSQYLLYIGKIDLARYISTSHYRLTNRGLFTDIYDMSELNDWSSEVENLTKLGGSVSSYDCTRVNMCLNTPVDVFTVVDNNCSEEEFILRIQEQKSEDEYLDILANRYNISNNASTDDVRITKARFVVLPAIELTSDKRGHSLELEVTPDSEKKRMKEINEKNFPTSYRIYVEVVDLGKLVDIVSPTKLFMKKAILNIEGKNGKNTYNLLIGLAKRLSSGWGDWNAGTINLDSYNLFTKEELLALDKETFNNLRANVMDLIMKVLYAYCTLYAQYNYCNTYRNSFLVNVFSPKFNDIEEGFLMRLQKSINAFWTGQKHENSSIIASNSVKPSIEDIIITELGKGRQKDDLKFKYTATGIFDILEKYCITENDLRQCTEYLN